MENIYQVAAACPSISIALAETVRRLKDGHHISEPAVLPFIDAIVFGLRVLRDVAGINFSEIESDLYRVLYNYMERVWRGQPFQKKTI